MATRLLFASLLGLLVGAGSAQQGPESAPRRPRLALLVGVQRYQVPTDEVVGTMPMPLAGVRYDIDGVRATLRRHYDFAPDDIEVLLDEDATHARVVERFAQHLIAKADDSTCAVFWFCGHGSRVADRSGREANKGMLADHGKAGGFDGSLLCFDSRVDSEHNRDLVDDELYSLLRVLAARCKQVVVVTDSCYSGDVTRGGVPAGTRFQPPDDRPWDQEWVERFWPPSVPLLDDDDPRRAGDEAVGARWIHVAASSNSELAFERRLPSGRSAGALTHGLTTILRQQQKRSWGEVALRVRAAVAAEFPQTVWSEGPLEQSVFGGTFAPLPPGFVAQVEADGRVLVEAGRLHGLGPGCDLDLVALDGSVLGRARVESVAAASAVCRREGGSPAEPVGTAMLARPRGRPTGRAPLQLGLGPGVPSDLLADCPYAGVDPGSADGSVVVAGDAFALLDREGYAARKLPRDAAARTDELRREYSYRAMRELVASDGSLPVALEVVATSPATREGLNEPDAAWSVQADGRIEVKAPVLEQRGGGGLISFRLHNRSKRELHCVLLSVTEDRSVHVIWPAAGQRGRTLRPGACEDALAVVGPSRSWPLPRPMVDRYVLVATAQFADFRPFESDSSIEDLAATRGASDGLPPALQLAARSVQTRGAGEADADFGIAWLDLVLTR